MKWAIGSIIFGIDEKGVFLGPSVFSPVVAVLTAEYVTFVTFGG
jgi:hypothetical protein